MNRVLFISYYFPPSGGPGVQRTLKFVKYLPRFGWQPTVLTVDPARAAYPDIDRSLEAEVPESVDVVRTPAWDPYGGYARLTGRSKAESVGVSFVSDADIDWKQRFARWVRANVFLPDARVGWVPFVVRAGTRLVQQSTFDAVVTTGPPHSTHLAGRTIARRTGLPWLADFRDPWTGVFYYRDLPMSSLSRRTDARLEHSVLMHADAVTVVSPTMASNLSRRVHRAYDYIPNGFDQDDVALASGAPDAFIVRHVGNMASSQDPRSLWKAVSMMAATGVDVSVELVGNVDSDVVASARTEGIGDRVRTTPYVPHGDAVQLMAEAAVLLLVIPDVPGDKEIVTGKVYEYVASGRPIVGIGPPGGDADHVLHETGAGRMFAHGDARGVADYVQSLYNLFLAGDLKTSALSDAAREFDRKRLAERLGVVLNRIAGGA